MPAIQITRFVPALLLALTFGAYGTSTSLAQENSASVKFNLFSVEGLVVGKNISIDAAYGEKHGVPVPAPFTFLVPSADGVVPLYNTATEPGGMLLKVSFATEESIGTDNVQLIENLQFVGMTLPMGDPEERMTVLAKLLANDAFSASVADYAENKYIGARKTKIGDYDAVEVVGEYIDPQLGHMYLRIVGIPNPDAPNSIFTIANVVASRIDLQSIDDLARTSSGIGLSRFKYK